MRALLKYRSALCVRVFGFIEEEEFCDMEIKARDRTFQCHKVILAAASPMFRGIIKSELAELGIDGRLVLSLDFLSARAMEGLLEYIYTGDCKSDIKEDSEFALAVETFFNPENHQRAFTLEEVKSTFRESLKMNGGEEPEENSVWPELEKQEISSKNNGTTRNRKASGKGGPELNDQGSSISNVEKGPFYIIEVDKSGKYSFLCPQQKFKLSLPRKPPFLCPCENCGKIFESFERLRSHYRHNHGEKKFKCSQCPLRFLYPKDLKCHMRTHTGEKPYICEVCGKLFAQLGSLGLHLKGHEKAEKINVIVYPCPECKKRYCRKEKPPPHHDIETLDLSSLRCPNNFCAKKFTSMKTLRKHIKNDVCNPGKSYCSECNTRFESHLLLKQHVGEIHCKHKRRQRRVRVDPNNDETENVDGAETSGIELDSSVIEIAEQGVELGFEQVDNILELCGEVVEMDADEANISIE